MNVIPQELRREETLVQIAEAIAEVNKISEDLLSRVSDRMSVCHTKLRDINARTRVAEAKITKLKGSKKAITVLAPAKYPESLEYSNSELIFDSLLHLEQQQSSQPPKNPNHVIQCKLPAHVNPVNVMKEKIQYYNVQVKKNDRKSADEEGLGDIPPNITSVSDLLLFNTSYNP